MTPAAGERDRHVRQNQNELLGSDRSKYDFFVPHAGQADTSDSFSWAAYWQRAQYHRVMGLTSSSIDHVMPR